jgi:hypothetical protein
MTRTKSKPPLHKPVFDENEVIRFAATGAGSAGSAGQPADACAELSSKKRKSGKDEATSRTGLTLVLSPEVIERLRAVAEHKGKTIDQVVEKLVTKHLGKH